MKSPKIFGVAVAALSLGISSAAWAGTAITGTGPTPSAAMDDANRRAQDESMRRWGRAGCYSPATFERCRQQGDLWICTAYVNNEAGSSC